MVQIDTDDLIDARDLAVLLGLSHPNSVSLYQRRYPGMPRPFSISVGVDLGSGIGPKSNVGSLDDTSRSSVR
jgi:hypothetical protein